MDKKKSQIRLRKNLGDNPDGLVLFKQPEMSWSCAEMCKILNIVSFHCVDFLAVKRNWAEFTT